MVPGDHGEQIFVWIPCCNLHLQAQQCINIQTSHFHFWRSNSLPSYWKINLVKHFDPSHVTLHYTSTFIHRLWKSTPIFSLSPNRKKNEPPAINKNSTSYAIWLRFITGTTKTTTPRKKNTKKNILHIPSPNAAFKLHSFTSDGLDLLSNTKHRVTLQLCSRYTSTPYINFSLWDIFEINPSAKNGPPEIKIIIYKPVGFGFADILPHSSINKRGGTKQKTKIKIKIEGIWGVPGRREVCPSAKWRPDLWQPLRLLRAPPPPP